MIPEIIKNQGIKLTKTETKDFFTISREKNKKTIPIKIRKIEGINSEIVIRFFVKIADRRRFIPAKETKTGQNL